MRSLIFRKFFPLFFMVVLAIPSATVANAYQRKVANSSATPPPGYGLPAQLPSSSIDPQADMDKEEAARRQKEIQKGLAQERSKEIKKETDQLLQLATE